MSEETKVCRACNTELPLTDFPKNGKYHKNTCKKCEYIKRNTKVVSYSREELKTKVKVCSTCGETKSLLHFTKNSTHKDGFYASCKSCLSYKKTTYEPKFKAGVHTGITKVCSICGEVHDLSFYSKAQTNKDGLRSWCKNCDAVRAKRRRTLIRKEVQDYKSKEGCIKCGEAAYYALDFHHKDPLSKTGNISQMMDSNYTHKLWDEITKCVILCRNCHAKFHHLERTEGITLKEYLKEV